MPTFLLTWNPNRFPWNERDDDIDALDRTGRLGHDWNHKLGMGSFISVTLEPVLGRSDRHNRDTH